jgi:ABC-type transport system involved in multi-copper enzyme maturation permease subunit
MILGPIFTADLVTSSRRTRYFLWRIAYGLVLLLTLWTNYEAVTFRGQVNINTAANFAESFFGSFAYMQVLAILAIGPAMAGGSIAQERERRTLEYLLATDLTTTEIVFGKLASRVLQIAAAILAGLPVMFIAGLLGGISPERLLMVMLLSGSTLLMVCCTSMAISTRAPRARDGVTRSYVFLAVLLLVPMIAIGVLHSIGLWQLAGWAGNLMAFNPLITLSQMLIRGLPLSPWVTFSWTLGSHLGLSAISVLLVYTKIRNVETVGQPRLKRARSSGVRRVSDEWPMLWKELRLRRPIGRIGVLLRVLFLAMLGAYLVIALLMSPYSGAWATLMVLIVMLACFGLLAVAARAATAISSERERSSWDSLRLTLLTDNEILWAKLCGAIYSVWGLALVLAMLWIALIALRPKLILGSGLWAGVAIVLLVYVAALGLRFSINAKNSVRAMIWTLATSVFIGGGYFFCCAPVMVGSTHGGEIAMAPAIPYLLSFPFFIWEESGSSAGTLTFAFLIGGGGYLIAAAVLYGASLEAIRRSPGE